MIDGDELLEEVNTSELLKLIEEQGLGLLRASIPRIRLIRIVTGEAEPETEDLCPTNQQRVALETFIYDNFNILRSQLGACRGRCTAHGCPTGIAVNCYDENREHLS